MGVFPALNNLNYYKMNSVMLKEFITDTQELSNENDLGSIKELKSQFPQAVPYSSGLGVVLMNPETGKSLRVNYSHGLVNALKDKSISLAQSLTYGIIGKTFTGNDPNKPRLTLRLPAGFNGSINLDEAIAVATSEGVPVKVFKLSDQKI